MCCPATYGMGPTSLEVHMKRLLAVTDANLIDVTLSDGETMEFIMHQDNENIVLTSLSSLSSGCNDGVAVDRLPEILAKLHEQNITFTALQFPHAFMIKGRMSNLAYRAHFNHIVLYKDSANQLNASIIDSTINPIGISNPIPVLNWLISSSIVSGEELLLVKLTRLLAAQESIESLRALCNQPESKQVNITSPIYTQKQPSTGDKRCAIYTLNAMVHLINYFISGQEIKPRDISTIATAAHQALNEADMMAISFPEAHGANNPGKSC